MQAYVGTYKDDKSEGIYTFDICNLSGTFSKLKKFKKIEDSKYIEYKKNFLYSIINKEENCGICKIDENANIVSEKIFEKIPSCHLVVDNEEIFLSNYHEGIITKINFEKNTELKYITEKKSKVHQVILAENLIYVPVLNEDKVLILSKNLELIDEINFKKNTGPRHGIIDKNFLFIISEFSCELYKIDVSTKKILEVIKLTKEKNSTGCSIRDSKCSKFLFVSLRGINEIMIIEKNDFKIKKNFSTYGKEPRDILNICDDKFIIVANKKNSKVSSICTKTGQLLDELIVPSCASIAVREENEK